MKVTELQIQSHAGTGFRRLSRPRPRGALKIEPMPAPIPTAKAIRRSWEFNLKMSAMIEPKPAPIKATGPSRPALPPEPIVIAEATNLTSGYAGG